MEREKRTEVGERILEQGKRKQSMQANEIGTVGRVLMWGKGDLK